MNVVDFPCIKFELASIKKTSNNKYKDMLHIFGAHFRHTLLLFSFIFAFFPQSLGSFAHVSLILAPRKCTHYIWRYEINLRLSDPNLR